MKRCIVCGVRKGLHEHHVVPRAYGGLNGPVVDICGAHHTLVHNAALKKSQRDREAELEGHTEQQKEKLRELITVIRKSRIASKQFSRPLTMQITFDAGMAVKVRQLKKLVGASSLEQTIIRCINYCYTVNTK